MGTREKGQTIMIERLRTTFGSVAPVKRFFWRRLYQLLAGRYPQPDLRFMNYGYVPADGEAPPVLAVEDEPFRLHVQLYHRVLRGADLRGRHVLEVGCGRGGGAAYLHRAHAPRLTVGLDFSERAVALCRRDYPVAGLTFVAGDAEALPFGDEAFDVIVNVESSHCYGSMSTFLREVRRLLRPTGYFLFADLRTGSSVHTLRTELRNSGLRLRHEEAISSFVVRALEQDSDRRQTLIQSGVPALFRGIARIFAGVRGTPMYEWLRDGQAEYLCCVLQKAEG